MEKGTRVHHLILGDGTVVGCNAYSIIVQFDFLDTRRTISRQRADRVMRVV